MLAALKSFVHNQESLYYDWKWIYYIKNTRTRTNQSSYQCNGRKKDFFCFFFLFSGAKAENLETKCDSSVLGMLCKMELWGDAERWWAWVNEVAAAVGLCILQREAEVGFGPQT